jgi:hypothetical protein
MSFKMRREQPSGGALRPDPRDHRPNESCQGTLKVRRFLLGPVFS